METFFGQLIFVGRKCSKGPKQYQFGPAHRYHFSLVTKNIVKVYTDVVGRRTISSEVQYIQRFYSLSANFSVFIFFLKFFKK